MRTNKKYFLFVCKHINEKLTSFAKISYNINIEMKKYGLTKYPL